MLCRRSERKSWKSERRGANCETNSVTSIRGTAVACAAATATIRIIRHIAQVVLSIHPDGKNLVLIHALGSDDGNGADMNSLPVEVVRGVIDALNINRLQSSYCAHFAV